MDNSRGAGAYGDGETFWVNQSCPLHASPAYAELLKAVGADKESSE